MSVTAAATDSAKQDSIALLYILAVAAFVCAVYYQSLASIVNLWSSSEYRYGALVFPISGFLLWRMRHRFLGVSFRPWAPGLAIIAGLATVWWVSRTVGVQVTEQLAAVLLIPAAVAALLGASLARRALFPLLFLIAVVPMADGLVPYLMRFTSVFSAGLLRLVGEPVFRNGNYITLPGGTFEIADVCSGLNYLVAGTTVALLFAYLTYRSQLKRAVFVLLAAAVLVLGNGLRAFIVMAIASATHLEHMTGRDHVWFGWFLFGGIVIGLFALASRWADAPEELGGEAGLRSSAPRSKAQFLPLTIILVLVLLAATAQRFQASIGSSYKLLLPAGALLLWMLYKQFRGTSSASISADGESVGAALSVRAGTFDKARALAVACAAVGLMAAGPIASAAMNAAAGRTQAQTLALPAIMGCTAPGVWAGSWKPELGAPDFSGAATFSCKGQPVNAFVGGYTRGGQGREVVNESYRLIPKEWLVSQASVTSKYRFDRGEGRAIEVNELRTGDSGTKALVWYWYRVGDDTAVTGLGVKVLQAYELVRFKRAGSAVYVLETPLDAGLSAGRQRLANVARQLSAVLGPNGSKRKT